MAATSALSRTKNPADAARLPYADGFFDLVAHANMIQFFDEVERVLAPGGHVLFAFSGGAETPIYVPFDRLRGELSRRGFVKGAGLAAGAAALLEGAGGKGAGGAARLGPGAVSVAITAVLMGRA